MLPTFFLIIHPTHKVSKTLYEHGSSGGLPKLSPSSSPCYKKRYQAQNGVTCARPTIT